MPIAKSTLNIALAPSQVWPTIAKFQDIHVYHPMVESVTSENHQQAGVGARRTCHFYDGTTVDEEITAWQEGIGYNIKLSKFSMPLKKATARMSVTPKADGNSEVALSMNFTAKGGPIGWLMAQTIMKPMIKRMLRKVLKGLEVHLETGDSIAKNGVRVPQSVHSAVA